MIRKLFLGVFLLSLLACSKDEKEPPSQLPYSFFNNPVISTGYYAYNINGSQIAIIGLPNTLREVTVGSTEYSMLTFPNPSWYQEGGSGQGFWTISLSPSFEGHEGKAWLVKAASSDDTSPFISENGTHFQNTGDPFIVWEGVYDRQILQVPVPASEDADYRLYIEVEGILIYDNLAVRQFLTY